MPGELKEKNTKEKKTRILVMFTAHMKPELNWVPRTLKLVLTGDALTDSKLSPTESFHHET